MTFRDKLKHSNFLKPIYNWLKRLYISRKLRKTGLYYVVDNIDENHNQTPLFTGICFWDNNKKIEVFLEAGNYSQKATLIENTELKIEYPKYNIAGFQILLDPANIPHSTDAFLVFKLNENNIIEHGLDWQMTQMQVTDFLNSKKNKLESIKKTVRCTICNSTSLDIDKQIINCTNCNATFTKSEGNYNFLSPELKKMAMADETENISAHNYDQRAVEIIESLPDGLILDNGAGLRSKYYSNVVNFEITDYPTTDVVGVGETLPFADEIFDAAFSLNVMEHVKDPFKYASELKRVVKKGGIIYSAVPFLQPYHGYPYHFYNMTSEGLKSLFEDTNILDNGIVEQGHPIFGISWILNEYVQGLPKKEKHKFSNLKVKDLIKDPNADFNRSYIQNLSEQAKNIISCVNYIVCEKK